MQYDFLHFLSHCKPGCKLLTYNNLELMYEEVRSSLLLNSSSFERKGGNISDRRSCPAFPWVRMAINTWEDKFEASWGNIRFHLWHNISPPTQQTLQQQHSQSHAIPIASPTASPSHSSSSSDNLHAAFSTVTTPRSLSRIVFPAHDVDEDDEEESDEPSSSP